MKRDGLLLILVVAGSLRALAASGGGLPARGDVLAAPSVFRPAQTNEPQDRANLQGLDPAGVEARIGPPDEKIEHGESDEADWVYNTKIGALGVHFQNGYVVTIDPKDFPVAKILK